MGCASGAKMGHSVWVSTGVCPTPSLGWPHFPQGTPLEAGGFYNKLWAYSRNKEDFRQGQGHHQNQECHLWKEERNQCRENVGVPRVMWLVITQVFTL